VSGKKAGNELLGFFQHLKYRFIYFTKVVFSDSQKADEFSGPFDHLKHRFLDLVQVAFLDIQKAENDFAWTFDP
jgi:hypothetical protein